MNLKIDIWALLLGIGIFQGAFLSLIINTKYKRKTSNTLLSILLLILVINLSDYLILHSDLYRKFPHFGLTGQPLLFLIGPVYYFYISSLINSSFRIRLRHFWHLLPIFVPLIYLLTFYTTPTSEKITLLSNIINNQRPKLSAAIVFGMAIHTLQTVMYIFFANRKLIQSKNQPSSKMSSKVFVRLRSFSVYFSVYWILIFITLIWLSSTNRLFREADYIIMLLTSFSINFLAFLAIGKVEVFDSIVVGGKEKYSKSILSDEKIKLLTKQLIDFIEKEKPYLNSSLRLSDLAKALSLSNNVLSQVLSVGLQKTFHELINEYRFAEMKSKLTNEDYAHLTIYGIAQESGFNNKHTYSKVFKDFTGMTPSAYLKAHPRSNGLV